MAVLAAAAIPVQANEEATPPNTQRRGGITVIPVPIPVPTPRPVRCIPRDKMGQLLGERYQEFVVSMGLANNGAMLEVFTTDNGSTWSIVMTTPNGCSRLLGSGELWEDAVPIGSKV